MSIRNIDADLASNKLNDLFHLHRYEDCVLFINRLNHGKLKQVLTQLPITLYLSRLPYTIEIFEAIYAKIFILDPDNFPTRSLQPERLIDKMISYFSLLSDQAEVEPIDGAKMLDSFENVIRIISYIQPNLYSRLLYFKYAIDRACLKFDKDLALYNKNLSQYFQIGDQNWPQTVSGSYSTHTINKSMSKKQINSYTNALLISRASNMQTCEKVRNELVLTINNCHKALIKLNEYISSLKSQKAFKQIQSYLNETSAGLGTGVKSPKKHKRNSSSNERVKVSSVDQTIGKARSESVSNIKSKKSSIIPNINNSSPQEISVELNSNSLSHSKERDVEIENEKEREKTLKTNYVNSSTICQDFIQNRLYLNKAMMNAIEPHLESIKLQQMLTSLYEKIDLDKEILLVFTHLKREENYLNSLEPLQPLFRRYSLGFERCIQIWRKKCSADSLLLFSENLNEANVAKEDLSEQVLSNKNYSQQRHKYLAALSATTAMAARAASNLESHEILNSNNWLSSNNFMSQPIDECGDSGDLQSKYHKYFSEVNLNTSQFPTGYSTMPAKLRSQKKTIQSDAAQNLDQTEYDDSLENIKSKRDKLKQKPALTKNVETQTNFDLIEAQHETMNENEIERLKKELENANGTILKLRSNENKLREKLKEKEDELAHSSSKQILINNENEKLNDPAPTTPISNLNEPSSINFQYTLDLIHIYNNLNQKYRLEAFESLDSVKEIQTMNEFKLKLLFSVIVLSYRYVKLYIRDLKRKIKTILQINDRSSSTNCSVRERSSSLKSKSMTPTIIVDKEDDSSRKLSQNEANSSLLDQVFFNKNDSLSEKSKSFKYIGRYVSSDGRKSQDHENSAQIIEQAVNKYLQIVTVSNSFDLNKIIEDVKEQLWTTLQEYPLKDCQELNCYINESVKTCWSLVNHQPIFKLDYSSTRYNSNMHERTDTSNVHSEQILHYIWPSLIDTSDNACASKGIVTT